jgi:hypothetical protein
VINKSLAMAAFAALLVAPLAAAQAPTQDQSKTQPQVATTVKPTTTLTGCLYREDQVPGRKPNIAERAGILEDYILTDTTISDPQQQPKPAAGGPTGTAGTVASTGMIYKVENIPDERLKSLVGKRVEVAGRIDPEGRGQLGVGGGPRPDRGPGPDTISLPEIEASSIREVAGKCAPTAPLAK